MAPRIVDKIAKRAEILQAGLRVFARKGFKNTKIVDIVVEAGIGKGTFYEYFHSKDEMLLAAFEDYMHQGDAATMEILASELSPLHKIRQLLVTTIELYGHDLETARVFFDFWLEGMQNEAQSEINFKKVYASYRKIITQLLQQAAIAGEVRKNISEHTASIFVGVVEGLFLQAMVDPSALVVTDTVEGIWDTLLNGIALNAPANQHSEQK